ncbi:Tim17/Tim22/Tim23/Pmp24 family-domain-containing protein [Sphaerosporella brunnea]|uniref:Tim17/Tim22/Tim23/Pmp24 family-domain-containing protein n=1 Tax=Sphaerosporella brunnea TaxID=1250544 RepID=A0A5J5ENG4_9PEZI|nr:Tim17/Tim22/Tim23/Pmp24 family-domain-containing protein [Sphaerosporella brunnea]
MASLWDAFTGRKSRSNDKTTTPTTSADAPPDSGDKAPTTSFTQQQPAFDYNQAADVSSFLTPAVHDPSQLHPLAGLGGDLTYLDLDEAALSSLPGGRTLFPSRGWSDDLCYGTGATYLVALSTGGAWGMVEGLKKTPAQAPPRIKLNTVLNAVTRRGPFMGNSAGIVAMMYNGINSTVGHYRQKHDTANSVISGILSGAIFKSTKGPKAMAVSAAIAGSAAGAWSVGSKAMLS